MNSLTAILPRNLAPSQPAYRVVMAHDRAPTIEIGDTLHDSIVTDPAYPPFAGRRAKIIACKCGLRFRAYVAKYQAGPRACYACRRGTPPATEARCA